VGPPFFVAQNHLIKERVVVMEKNRVVSVEELKGFGSKSFTQERSSARTSGFYCDDMPIESSLNSRVSNRWDKEIIDIPLSSPHACIGESIYFGSSREILVTRKEFAGHYSNPEVVIDPRVLNTVLEMLDCRSKPSSRQFTC
jgi:hypothetical protein